VVEYGLTHSSAVCFVGTAIVYAERFSSTARPGSIFDGGDNHRWLGAEQPRDSQPQRTNGSRSTTLQWRI